MKPLLVVAAEKIELSGLLRGRHARRLGLGVAFAAEIELGGRPWILAANGAGPARAADAVRALFSYSGPQPVLSTGFCGGLHPDLKVGDLVCGTDVEDVAGAVRYPCALPVVPGPCATGVILSQNRVAQSRQEKAALAASGAVAVEMEAAAVAAQAARYAAPCYCVRVVSDAAGETFAVDWNAFRRDDGRFDKSRLVLCALRRPVALLPEVLRMAWRARWLARVLGDFLGDTRF